MKAAIYTRYGSVESIRIVERPIPEPRAGEVLVRIRATSINGADWEGLQGKPAYARMRGLRRPRPSAQVLGSDIAGTVERAGAGVTVFQPGDEVFGETRGYQDGLAEFACTRPALLHPKPPGMTFEQASTLPQAGAIAMRGIIGDVGVQAGQCVLVNGAGGSAGMFAVQLAKLHGAEVTAVDSADKAAYLRELGADHVIDYRREDFTRNGEQYDLVLDVIARRNPLACGRALRRGGRYLVVGGSVPRMLGIVVAGPFIRRFAGRRMAVLTVPQGAKEVVELAELCVAGKVRLAIDRTFTLDAVADAFRYIASGQAKGKILVTMSGGG
jgi:NADPH:quinone reductase-like Zn-dependent oxidoreductase